VRALALFALEKSLIRPSATFSHCFATGEGKALE
jgi:hypothetical protein